MVAAIDEQQSLSALVQRIAAGGEGARDAEAALCQRFAKSVRLYGLRHLRDPEAAKDLVQVVLLGVLEAVRAGRVREPEHLDRFVLGACRNTSLRMRKTGARVQPTDSDVLEALLVPTEAAAVLDDRALGRCLDGLEARARAVVTMAFGEDRSAEQIADSLATTAGNVRVMRHRALAALRACLEGQGKL